jgi:hypothetical protein
MRIAVALALAAVSLVVAGCGARGQQPRVPAAATGAAAACPKPWRAGWQRIANRAGVTVYCPTWMPSPLDALIGGTYANTTAVSADRSYLVSFLSVEREAGGVGSEVHVNFRGYPGSTRIPVCEDTRTDGARVTRVRIPCFSDPRGTKAIGGEDVTVYTVNQGIDQWHVLYAWKRDASLYTISEHVAPPYTLTQVTRNLDRLMRGLVRLDPVHG